ncbi:MAG TPA: TVP38/TMEM64 family protein [Candidatus Binataceae bacterium]|nr:TVP38/TMEM64 family protein [Candidatus Binataceae bacterium]
MAAVSPIGSPARKPGGVSSLGMTLLKLAIVVLIAGGSAWLLIAHMEWFSDPRLIKREVLEAGVWAPIVYMLMYAVGPSFLVPGAVMTIAGGLAFGTVWGSVYSLIGADAGAIIAFGAGRFLGRSFVERIVGPRFHAMLDRIARNGFVIILYLRFVPVIPYNALNLLAGASPITFRDYFWASMIGMVPGTILFAFLGDALWHPMSWRFVLALGLIAASVGCGEIWRRWSSVKLEA